MSNTSSKPTRNYAVLGTNEIVTRTGTVVLCGRSQNWLVMQLTGAKAAICDFTAPVRVQKGQTLTVLGQVRSEGAETITLYECSVLPTSAQAGFDF